METAAGGFIARGWRPRRRAAEAAEGGGGARECGSGGRCERQRTGRQGHEQVASMTMLHRLRASTPAPQAPAPEMPAPETPAPETPPPGCVRDPCACHHALWQRVLVLARAAAAAARRVLHARCLRASVVSRVSTRGPRHTQSQIEDCSLCNGSGMLDPVTQGYVGWQSQSQAGPSTLSGTAVPVPGRSLNPLWDCSPSPSSVLQK